MAGREGVGAKILCHFEQIGKLDPLVAQDARHGRQSLCVGIGKRLHYSGAEAPFVVENVMGNIKALGNATGILDILPRAACAFSLCGRSVIVELQCHAHNVVAFAS